MWHLYKVLDAMLQDWCYPFYAGGNAMLLCRHGQQKLVINIYKRKKEVLKKEGEVSQKWPKRLSFKLLTSFLY
jgi:hypothetical protein